MSNLKSKSSSDWMEAHFGKDGLKGLLGVYSYKYVRRYHAIIINQIGIKIAPKIKIQNFGCWPHFDPFISWKW